MQRLRPREIEIGRVIKLLKELENLPAADWPDGLIPNTAGPTPHVKIRDQGLVVCSDEGGVRPEMMTWA